jgi:hypothetical protein
MAITAPQRLWIMTKMALIIFEEYLVGTDPKNPSSIYQLKIDAGHKLQWDTRPDRRYELQWTENLMTPFRTLKLLPYTTTQFQDDAHPNSKKYSIGLKFR